MANGKTGPRPYLSCPLCGSDTMLAAEYITKADARHRDDGPQGWVWWNGDEHDCCGCDAKLVVEADGETAHLAERYVEDDDALPDGALKEG